jgi:pimeloyl-ACP methyl ester carboxylesterase
MISPVDSAVAELGDAFVSGTANVNGTTLHYVRGGVGPAVILLHGFPQDWSAFRRIMPRLAANFTVVSVDMLLE